MPSEWTIDTLREHIAELRAADQQALALQHGEYLRRLEVLNHAHETAVEERSHVVSAEKFDDYVKSAELRLATALKANDLRAEGFQKRYEERHAALVEQLTVLRAGRRQSDWSFRRTVAICTIALSAAAILVTGILGVIAIFVH